MRLWCLPHSIAAWTTPDIWLGYTRGFSDLLLAIRSLATAVKKLHGSSSSLAVWCETLYTCYLLTYFLCLTHTGWLWLWAFLRGEWCGGRFQLLIHTPALYYCVITHCTVYNTDVYTYRHCFHCRSEKISQKIKTLHTWSIQVILLTNCVAMVPVHRRRRWSATKSVAFISVD